MSYELERWGREDYVAFMTGSVVFGTDTTSGHTSQATSTSYEEFIGHEACAIVAHALPGSAKKRRKAVRKLTDRAAEIVHARQCMQRGESMPTNLDRLLIRSLDLEAQLWTIPTETGLVDLLVGTVNAHHGTAQLGLRPALEPAHAPPVSKGTSTDLWSQLWQRHSHFEVQQLIRHEDQVVAHVKMAGEYHLHEHLLAFAPRSSRAYDAMGRTSFYPSFYVQENLWPGSVCPQCTRGRLIDAGAVALAQTPADRNKSSYLENAIGALTCTCCATSIPSPLTRKFTFDAGICEYR